jgi:hypothetical protein
MNNNVHIEIDGVDKLMAILKGMPSKTHNAVAKEMQDIVLDLQGKSQALAPVDTGFLQAAAFAEVVNLEGTVGYTAPYALRIHEEVGYRHPHGGQAKYLEEPYKANKGKYEKALIDAAKKAVAHE